MTEGDEAALSRGAQRRHRQRAIRKARLRLARQGWAPEASEPSPDEARRLRALARVNASLAAAAGYDRGAWMPAYPLQQNTPGRFGHASGSTAGTAPQLPSADTAGRLARAMPRPAIHIPTGPARPGPFRRLGAAIGGHWLAVPAAAASLLLVAGLGFATLSPGISPFGMDVPGQTATPANRIDPVLLEPGSAMADLRNPAADTAAMPAPLDLAALAPQPEPEPLFSPAPAAPESPPEATLQSEPAAAATAAVPPPPAPRPAMARPIDPPRPVTLAAAGADPPPAADAAAGDGSRVQVGAMRTAEAAQREWNRLRSLHPDLFAGIAPAVVRTQLARRNQVVWRLQTLPLPDRDSAGRLCNSLKQRRVDCLVVQG